MGSETSSLEYRNNGSIENNQGTRSKGDYKLVRQSSDSSGDYALGNNMQGGISQDESEFQDFQNVSHHLRNRDGQDVWEKRWKDVMRRLDKAEKERAEIRSMLISITDGKLARTRYSDKKAQRDCNSDSSDSESMSVRSSERFRKKSDLEKMTRQKNSKKIVRQEPSEMEGVGYEGGSDEDGMMQRLHPYRKYQMAVEVWRSTACPRKCGSWRKVRILKNSVLKKVVIIK